jgi:membrane associated rhomboid family serine protease
MIFAGLGFVSFESIDLLHWGGNYRPYVAEGQWWRVFLALLTTKVLPAGIKKVFLLSTLIFVGYNLVMGLAGGIDNAAHIGGLASGFVLGYVFYPYVKRNTTAETIIGNV